MFFETFFVNNNLNCRDTNKNKFKKFKKLSKKTTIFPLNIILTESQKTLIQYHKVEIEYESTIEMDDVETRTK